MDYIFVKNIYISGPSFNQHKVCEPIIRALPTWFELEDAIRDYLEIIPNLQTFVATVDEQPVGFCCLKKHNTFVWEIEIMAVLQNFHGLGIGTKLLKMAEIFLAEEKAEYLQVKTLGPSQSNKAYAQTRKFYRSFGFRELEEFEQIWEEGNPCLIMIKSIKME